MFVGAGTALNVLTVLVGSALGLALGSRLPRRVREVVTDALGLVTLLIAALSAAEVTDPALGMRIGDSAPVLVVLGALVVGGIIGSALRLEDRLERLGAGLQRLLSRGGGAGERQRFVQGFVTASLVFCIGPLTILGAINDGLGRGIDQLALKATLDGFAAVAFAASFGIGVMASVVALVAVQLPLTLVGVALGDVLPAAHLAALTAVGGLVLAGVGLRLLGIRQVPVADLLPALVVAPLVVQLLTLLD